MTASTHQCVNAYTHVYTESNTHKNICTPMYIQHKHVVYMLHQACYMARGHDIVIQICIPDWMFMYLDVNIRAYTHLLGSGTIAGALVSRVSAPSKSTLNLSSLAHATYLYRRLHCLMPVLLVKLSRTAFLPTNMLDHGWSGGALPPAPCRWDELCRASWNDRIACSKFPTRSESRPPASAKTRTCLAHQGSRRCGPFSPIVTRQSSSTT